MIKDKDNIIAITSIFVISLFLAIASLYLSITTQNIEDKYNYDQLESNIQSITDNDKLKSIAIKTLNISRHSQQSLLEAYYGYSICIFGVSVISFFALLTAYRFKKEKLLTSSSSETGNP